jgi:hypothetical protein
MTHKKRPYDNDELLHVGSTIDFASTETLFTKRQRLDDASLDATGSFVHAESTSTFLPNAQTFFPFSLEQNLNPPSVYDPCSYNVPQHHARIPIYDWESVYDAPTDGRFGVDQQLLEQGMPDLFARHAQSVSFGVFDHTMSAQIHPYPAYERHTSLGLELPDVPVDYLQAFPASFDNGASDSCLGLTATSASGYYAVESAHFARNLGNGFRFADHHIDDASFQTSLPNYSLNTNDPEWSGFKNIDESLLDQSFDGLGNNKELLNGSLCSLFLPITAESEQHQEALSAIKPVPTPSEFSYSVNVLDSPRSSSTSLDLTKLEEDYSELEEEIAETLDAELQELAIGAEAVAASEIVRFSLTFVIRIDASYRVRLLLRTLARSTARPFPLQSKMHSI